jgi:hypothetical protein
MDSPGGTDRRSRDKSIVTMIKHLEDHVDKEGPIHASSSFRPGPPFNRMDAQHKTRAILHAPPTPSVPTSKTTTTTTSVLSLITRPSYQQEGDAGPVLSLPGHAQGGSPEDVGPREVGPMAQQQACRVGVPVTA